MAGTIPRGRICWHELLTTDTDAAAKFYTRIVGWGLMPWEHDPSYRMWTVGGKPVGGLMALPEDAKRMGAPPNWLWYASTPNVDDTVRQATGRGAKVLSGMSDVPNVGRMAVMSDPQGAVFAAYQPSGETPGHDGKPKVGEFSWHELATTDWKSAFDFYHALFGWEKTDAMDMGPAGTYQMFGRMGITVGGIYNKPPEMTAPPHWLCYAKVPNADKAAALAAKLGGKVVRAPMEVPGGNRIAQCMDPQGAAFAVHAVPAAAAAPKKPAAKPKKKAKPAKRKATKKARTAKKRPPAKKKPARKGRRTRAAARRSRPAAKKSARRKKKK